MKPTYEELEQQLEESRREFRAADATIHNLELKLTDMAVQLANAESKCRELVGVVAENSTLKSALNFAEPWLQTCDDELLHRIELTKQTPATDAFLAEVRAQGVEMLKEHVNKWMHDMNLPADMQFEHSEFVGTCDEFAAQLRKGGAL